jgi:hypothetical protein
MGCFEKFNCAICDGVYRKNEMVRRDGYLVCKATCDDKDYRRWTGNEVNRRIG